MTRFVSRLSGEFHVYCLTLLLYNCGIVYVGARNRLNVHCECCKTAAGLLQRCCRTDADFLQIMKAHYLQMLIAKFKVSKSNSMAVREL